MISYDRLWKTIEKMGISESELISKAGLTESEVESLHGNGELSIEVFERICGAIKVGFPEVMEYVPEN